MFKLSPAPNNQSVGTNKFKLTSTEAAKSKSSSKHPPTKQPIDNLRFKRAVGEVPQSQRIFKPLSQRTWPSFEIKKPTQFTFKCGKPDFTFTALLTLAPTFLIDQASSSLPDSGKSE
jgi:hypothetical protein